MTLNNGQEVSKADIWPAENENAIIIFILLHMCVKFYPN